MMIRTCTFLFGSALLMAACDYHATEVSQTAERAVYSHSFELPADTIGWSEYGSLDLYPSAPNGGGSWSARVSGGCIVPHAHKRIVIQPNVRAVVLEFWGKNLAVGGGVQLYKASDRSNRISMQVTDTLWTLYRSSDFLACAANDTLELEMISGGIMYSAMLIDNLKISRVP